MRGPSAVFGLGVATLVALLVGGGWLLISHDGAYPHPNPTRGAQIFATQFQPTDGLGPLFNGASCLTCHNTPVPGGTGPNGLSIVLRVGRLTSAGFDPMLGHGGPVARAHSIAELGASCSLVPGIPPGANVTSVRNAPALFGDGLLDAIPDAAIMAGAVPRDDRIHGRPNLLDGRVGRFGWKADTPTLREFVGEAFRNELGMTNPIAPIDLAPAGECNLVSNSPKIDLGTIDDVVAFVDGLPVASSSGSGDPSVFDQVGCNECHVATLGGVPAYTDLLLHDMGSTLDDGVVQAGARGQDWRTAPLWGLRQRSRFLHDGRAQTVDVAILAHGGEASAAIQRFRTLPADQRAALLAFLGTL